MKRGNQPLLQLRGQIDEQVAAADDVQLREGWIHDDVLWRKHHHLPDLLAHAEATLLVYEEAPEPLRRDVGCDVVRIQAKARAIDGVPIQIGSKNLQRDVASSLERLNSLLMLSI